MMKQFFKSLMLSAVAALSIVSCSDSSDVDEYTNDVEEGTTLTAAIPSTKVTFEDESGAGIKLSWDDDDTFCVYDSDSGEYVCEFICEDVNTCTFTSDTSLTDNQSYIAVYSASQSKTSKLDNFKNKTLAGETQDGDSIDDLDNACIMISNEFAYKTDTDIEISFEHKKAVMTFTFQSEEMPSKLIFENGDDKYTVEYATEAVDGYYTSYIMIDPCDNVERELVFTLYNSDGVAYDMRKVNSSVAYAIATRYTSPVSDIKLDISYTADGVYEIHSAKGLKAFANLVNGVADDAETNWKDYACDTDSNINSSSDNFEFSGEKLPEIDGKLTTNINLSEICGENIGNWSPIGNTSDKTFKYEGTFDGCGNEVTGLYINNALSQQALFGFTSTESVVRNLGVSGNVYCMSEAGTCYEIAGVVAYNHGSVINCYSSVNVSGERNVGGILGHNEGYILNCYNLGEIKGHESTTIAKDAESMNVGGISGRNDATMYNCYSTVKVTGNTNIGGVLGNHYSGGKTLATKCCYCSDLNAYSIGNSAQTASRESLDEMKAADFVSRLNKNITDLVTNVTEQDTYTVDYAGPSNDKLCQWQINSNGFPTHIFKTDAQ